MDFDFKIGAPVLTREGVVGRLKYLVVDPQDESVTSLVVERGKLLRRDKVVPVSWVESAGEQGVVLDASVEELESLPDFREVEYRSPEPSSRPIAGHPPEETLIWLGPYVGPSTLTEPLPAFSRPWTQYQGRLGLSDDEVVVRRGQPVYASDGRRIATLDHVLADTDTGRIRYLIVHRGRWLQRGEDIIVPDDAVAYITDQEIRLTLSRDELNRLPRYRPPMDDSQLEHVITRGLRTQTETRGQNLNVQVDRGMAHLSGEVSAAAASVAQSIARAIQGIIGVADHTVRPDTGRGDGRAPTGRQATAQDSDTATAARIAEAMNRQRYEDLSGVGVQVDQGVATLTGTTPNVAGKALAGEIAKRTPGVTSVLNLVEPDTVVRARVEAALAEDPRTAAVPIDVIVRNGVVTLIGRVPSVEVEMAAEQIARSTPGVIAVLDEIEVRVPEDESDVLVPDAIRLHT